MSNIPVNEWHTWFTWYPFIFKNQETGKYTFNWFCYVYRRLTFTKQDIFQYEYTTNYQVMVKEVLSKCM